MNTTDPLGRTKILIVEDEAIIAIMLEAQLPASGYQVFATVPTGEQAVEQARLLHPDVVIMDIHLSGEMNGIEAARQIMEQLKIPVIFLTGYSNDRLMNQALALQPAGYLVKPVEFDQIAAAIEKANLQRIPTHPLFSAQKRTGAPN